MNGLLGIRFATFNSKHMRGFHRRLYITDGMRTCCRTKILNDIED